MGEPEASFGGTVNRTHSPFISVYQILLRRESATQNYADIWTEWAVSGSFQLPASYLIRTNIGTELIAGDIATQKGRQHTTSDRLRTQN